jgi:hypothetical protein
MRWALRLAANLPVAACLAVAGCGFAQKPYANDPLLRAGRAPWITHDTAQPIPSQPPAEKESPPPTITTYRPRD